MDASALVDAAVHRQCYELHIGAEHLAWNVWVGNQQELAKTAEMLSEVLGRGPRTDSDPAPIARTSRP